MIKLNFLLKSFVFATALMATSLFFSACNSPKSDDSKDIAEAKNDPKNDPSSEKDEKFLVKAAEMSLMEIQLGQLAQQKGTTDEIKSLGKMLEDAHNRAIANMNKIASVAAIAIPTAATENTTAAYNKLNEKTGADFDKEYCEMVVREHKDAIDLFEKASPEIADLNIKGWTDGTLPQLRAHLADAVKCQQNLKGM